jgi:sec-independent protein translocase protein TatA
MLAFMGLPGGAEWLIILLIALLLFGSRLPSVMRSLGQSVNQFKKGLKEVEDEVTAAGDLEDEKSNDDRAAYPEG